MRMGPRRSIHYGSYHFATRTITIHPILDSPTVPDWFVRFVIFHELIHAVLPEPVMVNGRRKIHDPQFRQMEESHPDYDRAGAFAQEFLRRFR
jgi:predicted metal-dependent hydrolase